VQSLLEEIEPHYDEARERDAASRKLDLGAISAGLTEGVADLRRDHAAA